MNKEITVKSERIFDGKVINLRVDTVELENQKYTKREIIEHNGATAIIAVNEAGEIILVKQYRKAIEDFILELPAGKIEAGEEPLESANRELIEETGYKADEFEKIFDFYPEPGFSNEKIYLYKAKGLNFVGTKFDEDEFIESIVLSKEDVKKLLDAGKFCDGKTLIGILYWLNQ